MRRVLVLEHAEAETPGRIETSLLAEGYELETLRAYAGEPVPADLGTAAGLVVLGGPMGVYEEKRFTFLTDELRLIERALWWGAPVLGVCLGSQMLAKVLGAPVTRGPRREIGWFPVHLTPEAAHDRVWAGLPSPFFPFHWHGDLFGLPSGATSLARSSLTPHQAFRHGTSSYGFLFHLEVLPEQIDAMCAAFPDEVEEAGAETSAIQSEAEPCLRALRPIADQVLRRWARLLAEE